MWLVIGVPEALPSPTTDIASIGSNLSDANLAAPGLTHFR
jgi:hypothetical protein